MIWALKDISFELKHGEAVGIIGRNGAGKSTLLKILSRITEPTRGRAQVFGRVGSLLEVGTGFHPDLTGRENVYLNGTILGMKKREIDTKFDEIIDFSGVEKFIDTPVKRYSSGMRVRLAFSVAAHLEPEILIIDEVLAVGDLSFQKKCLGKMGDVTRSGRTVLFVSHNMTAVQAFCGQGIWLDSGTIKQQGGAQEVVTAYLQAGEQVSQDRRWPDDGTAPGDANARLLGARIVPQEVDELMSIEKPVCLEFIVRHSAPECLLNISCHVYNQESLMAFNAFSKAQKYAPGLLRFKCVIPPNLFNDGFYSIEAMLVIDASRVVAKISNCLCLEMHDPRQRVGWMAKLPGVVRPATSWEVEPVSFKE
jgi:lipopolysaccharide transport system ATP-binding protein